MISSTQANPNFLKFANDIQIGPIVETTIDPGATNGPALYIGTDPDPSIISNEKTQTSLENINNQTLRDMSIYVEGPDGTSIYLSMDALYFTIDYLNNSDGGSGDTYDTSDTHITFQAIDAVSNGQVGQMIVFGSQFMPLIQTQNNGDDSDTDTGD